MACSFPYTGGSFCIGSTGSDCTTSIVSGWYACSDRSIPKARQKKNPFPINSVILLDKDYIGETTKEKGFI